MQTRLMQWLACPICTGEVRLIARDENPPAPAVDITFGALTCGRCNVYYPIWNGVPRMLTYRTGVAELHAAADPDWIAANLNG